MSLTSWTHVFGIAPKRNTIATQSSQALQQQPVDVESRFGSDSATSAASATSKPPPKITPRTSLSSASLG